ncbi:MAG: heavy-metal-associated domain-containing protein [Nitrospinae bacterium]|nr:heavy-metal-associated domain-containing protein [Nitrospinota bacterium]
MSCNHCKMRVTEALTGVFGVISADVDVAKKRAVVEASVEIPDEVLKKAVQDAGYSPTAVANG